MFYLVVIGGLVSSGCSVIIVGAAPDTRRILLHTPYKFVVMMSVRGGGFSSNEKETAHVSFNFSWILSTDALAMLRLCSLCMPGVPVRAIQLR